MKMHRPSRSTSSGNVLMVALIIGGVIGLVLFSYLAMVGNQQSVTARSQTWNSCIAIAEAGVEEALAHLNQNGAFKDAATTNNLVSNGWTLKGTDYYKKRDLDKGYYEVYIKPGARPTITSTGYLPAPVQSSSSGAFLAAKQGDAVQTYASYVSRTVQVKCRAIGRFTKAVVARDKVELNGKNVTVDSYHSYDPASSTYNLTNASQWGLYDPSKRQDHGDVAVIAGLTDDLSISSAKVRGKVSTGPDGDIKNNKSAVVGSLAWHDAGKTGVEPGWSSNDANFDMPAVVKPFSNGTGPSGGTVGTNYYDYILGDGDYKMSQLKGKVIVTGKARLLVTSKIEFSDDHNKEEGIDFEPNARLEIYMEGKEAKLRGKKDKKKQTSLRLGFNTDGNTTNFFYYGLPKNEKLELKNMDDFAGIVYAPNAEVILKAGSIKYYRAEYYGSIQGFKVKLEKNATFHYDENIGTLPAESFVVESWKEL